MDLLDATLTWCRKYRLRPERSKGQNFLINEDVYRRIIESADLKKDDTVLEIGSGLGFLTLALSDKVKKVVAVELDETLVKILKKRIEDQGRQNIKVFHNDILKARGANLAKLGPYKVVSNLPYNITSVFLRKFLSLDHKPSLLLLLLQREIVDRIRATSPRMNLLACSVQFYAQAEMVFAVDRENFYPQPRVDSAVIKIVPGPRLLPDYEEEKKFFKLLRVGFGAKRKMLKNNLISGLKLEAEFLRKVFQQVGLTDEVRAEQLAINDWLKLYSLIKSQKAAGTKR